MVGINGSEFLVLLVVAAVVLGPERLPQYAQQLARLIRELRRMAQGAQEKVREELGPDFDDVDWRKLDPRQYDPRRIMREALTDSVDLDDPLGLRDVPRSDRADGAGYGTSGYGGPGSASFAAANRSVSSVPPEKTVSSVPLEKTGSYGDSGADPLFDPDTT